MSRAFRVLDCRKVGDQKIETIHSSTSPERAAFLAIGEDLVRGRNPRDLRAKVYFTSGDEPMSMVRLYSKSPDRKPKKAPPRGEGGV